MNVIKRGSFWKKGLFYLIDALSEDDGFLDITETFSDIIRTYYAPNTRVTISAGISWMIDDHLERSNLRTFSGVIHELLMESSLFVKDFVLIDEFTHMATFNYLDNSQVFACFQHDQLGRLSVDFLLPSE